jgi:Putative adhesin
MTVAALVAAGLVPVLHAQEPFKWQGKLAAGKTIEIKNINGEVHATGGSGSEVTVTARKSAHKSDPDEVEIRVVQHEEGVTICAVYPSRKNRPANDCRPGSHGHNDSDNNDVEVEFDVSVPKGVRFVGRSVNGEVTAESIAADAAGYTVNGDVRVTASGVVEATTVNGSIVASMGRSDWANALEFNTVNGSVTLTFPGDLNTELDVRTVNGSIDSDFPITISGKVTPQSLRGRVGQGGRDLSIETVNGSIRLRKRA